MSSKLIFKHPNASVLRSTVIITCPSCGFIIDSNTTFSGCPNCNIGEEEMLYHNVKDLIPEKVLCFD